MKNDIDILHHGGIRLANVGDDKANSSGKVIFFSVDQIIKNDDVVFDGKLRGELRTDKTRTPGHENFSLHGKAILYLSPMISIIFPCFNEESNLRPLLEQLKKVTDSLPDTFEFLFVDDASTDGTARLIDELQREDERVHTVRLARNAGSHAAISAGLSSCSGDAAIVMAADLQDPPRLIPLLIEQWKAGYRIVWGARAARMGESLPVKIFSRAYHAAMNVLTTVKFPPKGADVFLADRAAIDAMKNTPEKHTSVFMLLAWIGFSQTTIEYVKEARHSGRSKWTFAAKIKLALDTVISFSDIPLRYMSIIGVLTALIGIAYAVTMLFQDRSAEIVMLTALLLVGGIQMLMLGILGEYLWRTFDESRHRPRYIVEHKK